MCKEENKNVHRSIESRQSHGRENSRTTATDFQPEAYDVDLSRDYWKRLADLIRTRNSTIFNTVGSGTWGSSTNSSS